MRKINREETKKLLKRAIRRWFNTYNEVVVYDPIYEDETVDENLISLKMEEISAGTIVIDPIFYGKPYDEAAILTDEIEWRPIKYENKIYSNYEKLIEYLLEEAERREFEKVIEGLKDCIYTAIDKFKRYQKLKLQTRLETEENYDDSSWEIKILIKDNKEKDNVSKL